MVNFSNLPSELLDLIITLSVEDAIVLREENIRRKTLRNLSLVSREFVRPSQAALWSYLSSDEAYFYGFKFNELVGEGFASKMIVKELEFKIELDINQYEQIDRLVCILSGVYQVRALKLSSSFDSNWTQLPNIFSLNSLRTLKSLELISLTLPNFNSLLPSTLTRFSWNPCGSTSTTATSSSLIFNALRASPCSIHNLRLSSITMSQTLIIGFREKFEEFFRLRGSKIRVLEFGFFDLSFLSLLLPFTSSLKSLKIQFRNPSNLNRRPSLSNMISLLSFLPIDTPLYMLDISSFYLNLSSDADCLIPLLVLPQLSKLRKLYCTDSTPITRLKFRPKSLEGKKVEVIREGSKELLKMIEFSERSGVQLIPRSENDERISRIKILRQMKVIKN